MNLKKAILFSFFIAFSLMSYGQSLPPNIDFESGNISYWHSYRGTVATGPVYSVIPSVPSPGLQTLTSGTDTDYYGGFPVVGEGLYSLKLAHDTVNRNADRVVYYIDMPSGSYTYSLICHIAVVVEDPLSHTLAEEPGMMVEAFDSTTGVLLSCDSFDFVASSSLYSFKNSTQASLLGSGYDVMYLPWSAANLNLDGMAGRTVTVMFTVAGCSLGTHFGYGYVDMTGGLFATETIVPCDSLTDTLYGPSGYASYQWYDSATFTTTYGTTKDVVITTPPKIATYAVVLDPLSGFGCPDTLYTRVIPCSSLNNAYVSNKQQVEIFPNPAADDLTIMMSQGAYTSFAITNDIGQELVVQQLDAAETKVNIKTLPAGLYYITLNGDNGTTVKKFVKM